MAVDNGRMLKLAKHSIAPLSNRNVTGTSLQMPNGMNSKNIHFSGGDSKSQRK